MKKSFYIILALVALAASAPKMETERLICAEAEMSTFPYCKNDLRVVKHQTVTPVEGIDGLEIIETFFVNEGKPVTVKAYELCRTEITPQDSVVWSLQPSSTAARMDWTLPVTEGFYQRNYLGMNNTDYGGGIPVVDLWQRDGGIAIGLFEPVWCAWGYGRPFKMDMVLGTLDKVAELGFTWVDIDDGYQIAEGDWNTNKLFPGGDKDMRHITDEVHKRGLKAKLWWAPLAADPDTKLVKEHPEMLLLTEEWAHEYITWWDSWYLSPVNPAVDAYTTDLLHMFLDRWNFDGLKIDGQHLNCCLPDYNELTGLANAWEAPEQMPTYFEKVYQQAQALKPHAVIQVCPCGCAVNYFLVPHINQAVASDPMSSRQVRMKRKAYAALAPGLAYYGDHVELTDGGNDFASQIGTGSVIGTKFTWPKDNPDWSEGPFLLTPEKEALIRKWMKIYKENNLAKGEYLNLYTWGYDYPETHVIRQNDAMYYAFYVDDASFSGTLELRGLDPEATYTAVEYTADEPRSFTVNGADPHIEAEFTRSYLLKLTKN